MKMKPLHSFMLAGAALIAAAALQVPAYSASVHGLVQVAQKDSKDKKDGKKDKKAQKDNKAKQREKKAESKQQKPQKQQKAEKRNERAKPEKKPEKKPVRKPVAQNRQENKQENKQEPIQKSKQEHKQERKADRKDERKEKRKNERKSERKSERKEDKGKKSAAPVEAKPAETKKETAQPAAKPSAAPAAAEVKKSQDADRKKADEKKQDANRKQDNDRNRNADRNRGNDRNGKADRDRGDDRKRDADREKDRNRNADRDRDNDRKRDANADEPVKPKKASEFIRRKGEKSTVTIKDVRKNRRETREGNRVIIHEGDRKIVHNNNRVIIRHNEASRFAVGARNVRVDRRNGQTVTIIERPNGVKIVNITDDDGHLIRRVRRDRSGREVVIIDNSFAGRRRPAVNVFVDLAPVHIRDRSRYYIDAGRASPAQIFAVFTAPPVVQVEDRYTVEQVRYSYPLRERMPRVDLDINFEIGSWQLTPDQVAQLQVIADGLNRAIDENPREVFLIEGHTDAIGANEDNLSLSDRRAEAVAVALTEQFNVPPENLVTQGYGEEHLKVDTQGPSRENRRVTVLRITPLIDQAQR
jgi:outer membrane protein OmpA-like peptidoglycan-associated protein